MIFGDCPQPKGAGGSCSGNTVSAALDLSDQSWSRAGCGQCASRCASSYPSSFLATIGSHVGTRFLKGAAQELGVGVRFL